jgi:hypothetical protein
MKQDRDDKRSSFDSRPRKGEGSWTALGAATVLVVVLIGIVSTYLWVKGRIGGGATQVAPTLKWESFSPPGANFRLDTPGPPGSQDIPGVAGSHLYFARTSPPAAMTFMLQFVELSPAEARLPEAKLADDIIETVLKMSPESKRVADRPALLGGRAAHEYEVDHPRDKTRTVLRLCIVGRSAITLGVSGPSVTAANADVAHYFNSFEFLDKSRDANGKPIKTTKGAPSSEPSSAKNRDKLQRVMIVISGVEDEAASQRIQEKLKELAGVAEPKLQAVLSRRGTLTVSFASPVDPQALADKIDFGTVTRVQGRTIRVTMDKP